MRFRWKLLQVITLRRNSCSEKLTGCPPRSYFTNPVGARFLMWLGVNMNRPGPLTVTAFQKRCRCWGKSGTRAPCGLAAACCPGVAVCPARCWWGSPAPREAATLFLPSLPLEYCLNQAFPPASEMVLHCLVSACLHGGVLLLPVFTSPAPPPGRTAGNAQALHGFPNNLLVQLKGKHKILWGKKNPFLSTAPFH